MLLETKAKFPPADPADYTGAQPNDIPAKLLGSESILILSDPPLLCDFTMRVLRHFGYTVMKATSSIEAEACIRASPEIKLIFIDWAERETGQLNFALWVRSQHPGVRVLLSSEKVADSTYMISDADHIAYLVKPFTTIELGDMVRRVLD